jgi:2-(1,2-epoxy-1,2-dihydrophenyl)acetyl-CoA isomerase
MDLALTARPVSAEEALAMGLVSRMVEDADLAETAAAIAREFATKSAPAVAAVKRQLRANPAGTLDAALDVERDTQSLLGASVEYRNAVLHFSRPRT